MNWCSCERRWARLADFAYTAAPRFPILALLSHLDQRLAALDGAAHEGEGVLLEELERWFPQSKEKE